MVLQIQEADLGYSKKIYDALTSDFADGFSGKIDPKFVSDNVELWLFNTKKLYDEIFNKRRKAYSVAYEAMLDLFRDVVYRYYDKTVASKVDSQNAQRWLKQVGIDYKEMLKPVIDRIEEERAEREEENKTEALNISEADDEFVSRELTNRELQKLALTKFIKFTGIKVSLKDIVMLEADTDGKYLFFKVGKLAFSYYSRLGDDEFVAYPDERGVEGMTIYSQFK